MWGEGYVPSSLEEVIIMTHKVCEKVVKSMRIMRKFSY